MRLTVRHYQFENVSQTASERSGQICMARAQARKMLITSHINMYEARLKSIRPLAGKNILVT